MVNVRSEHRGCGSVLPRLTPQHRPSPDGGPPAVNDTQTGARRHFLYLDSVPLPPFLPLPTTTHHTAPHYTPAPRHIHSGIDNKSMDSELPFGYARREKVQRPKLAQRFYLRVDNG